MKLYMTLLAVVGALLTAGCGGKANSASAPEPPKNPLEITPGADLKSRIRVGQAGFESVSSMLRVSGRVEADASRMAKVSAPVTGRIVELKALEGEHVEKGQVLATVYSTELSSAESDLLKVISQRQVADRAVNRAKQLLDAGVIGSAELQRREAELQQATSELAAARERLRILGLTDEAITKVETSRVLNSMTHILSSISGLVLERKATIGQMVQAVEPVFVIADLSRVWLVADVPEQSAGNIRVGKAIEAEIPALPGAKVRGKLSFVSAMVNPETRTVSTRMTLDNPQRLFKPAMLTTMTLVDGAERKLVLPTTAVVREGNDDCVFVKTGPNTFTLRTLKLAEDTGEKRVVMEGLQPNEEVVLEGAFHLNNERKRQALGGSEGS